MCANRQLPSSLRSALPARKVLIAGLFFLLLYSVTYYLCSTATRESAFSGLIVMALIVTVTYALMGFMDDWLKISKKNTDGLSGKMKIIVQTGVGLGIDQRFVIAIDDGVPGVFPQHTLPSFPSHFRTHCSIIEKQVQLVCEIAMIPGFDEEACFTALYDMLQTPYFGCNDRFSGRHSFHCNDSKRLRPGGGNDANI